MKRDYIGRINVDLPIDSYENLSSPQPNGAKFNWKTLKLDLPEQSSENATTTPVVPMGKGSLVRSPALSPESWQAVIEARKALLLQESQVLAKPEAKKSSDDVELAGEGE